MARIRTIKPDFFRHEGLQDLAAKHGAEVMLVFAGLWGHCDKAGRFEWKPRMLKLDILPFLEFNMSDVLNILCDAGFILKYEADSREFGEIASFERHQRIGGKEAQEPAKHPEPVEYKQGSTGEALGKQQGLQEGKGREEEGNGIGKGIGMDICRAATPRFPQVDAIFDFWKTTLGHERSILDSKRRKLIEARLKDGYSETDLRAAIVGCSLSPFHMGENEKGQRYDGIDLIFRNAEKVDQFVQMSVNPPVAKPAVKSGSVYHDSMVAAGKAIFGDFGNATERTINAAPIAGSVDSENFSGNAGQLRIEVFEPVEDWTVTP